MESSNHTTDCNSSTIQMIEKYINKNFHIMSKINIVPEDSIFFQLCMMTTHSNYLYENKINWKPRQLRFAILDGYEKSSGSANLFRIFMFHLINKYEYFKNIEIPKNTELEIKNLIDVYSEKVLLVKKQIFELENKSGLDLRGIHFLLNSKNSHLIEIYHDSIRAKNNTIENYTTEILVLMTYMESNCEKKYGLFRFSVLGDDCTHCNFFLFDSTLKTWYRIESGGFYYCVGECKKEHIEQYNILDCNLKKSKDNYYSHTDYHFIPGLHSINKGPYCAYYCVMIVEEYINNDVISNNELHKMMKVIEKVSDFEFIESKLREYNEMLKNFK